MGQLRPRQRESKDLPGFIVLNGGLIPPGGLDNFNSGFLPAAYQGSVFRAGDPPVANVVPLERDAELQTRQARPAAQARRRRLASASASADEIESAIANYETAFRMQAAVPELMDLTGEIGGDAEALRPRRRVPADADLRPRSA